MPDSDDDRLKRANYDLANVKGDIAAINQDLGSLQADNAQLRKALMMLCAAIFIVVLLQFIRIKDTDE